MVKNLMTFLLAFLTMTFMAGVSKVEAVPFINVQGFVTPTFGGPGIEVNGTTTFSAVQYTFSVIQSIDGAEIDFAILQFESGVFLSVGPVTAVNPGDWTVNKLTIGGHIYESASAGTTLGAGEALSFIVNDVVVNTLALSDPSYWSESQIWAQGWIAGDGDLLNYLDPSTYNAIDGGSTVVTPEPASLLLLGSGLAGLGLFGRRKKNRGRKL